MIAIVALGSSSPDACAQLARAVNAIDAHPLLRVVAVSHAYENPAAGDATSARFVNAAAVVDTALTARALLSALHAIERAQGRVRDPSTEPWRNGSRTIDLDVAFILESAAFVDDGVVVPHPRACERNFVVVPALDALARARLAAPPALRAAESALHAVGPLFVRADAAIARP